MQLDFHPVANIFPLMTGAEYDALVADIAEHGQAEPIWLCDGMILDGRGHHRHGNHLTHAAIGPEVGVDDQAGHLRIVELVPHESINQPAASLMEPSARW